MPPRGGNPMLSDEDLRDIVAHLRTLQGAAPAAAAAAGGPATRPGAGGATAGPAAAADDIDPALLVPRWVVSSPSTGPQGIAPQYLADVVRPAWQPPRDGVAFANGYYVAAQFGGLNAALVALAFVAMFVHGLRRGITAERSAALQLGFAGCLVMTVTWLIVWPVVYT